MKQGFYVKHKENYLGPFDKLNEARSEARKIGSDISIYHGVLKDGIFNGKLVPKIKDNENEKLK